MIALKSHVEERGRVTEKVYRYSDLKDLQSKLTLVAGDKQKQNKETIRRFDEVCLCIFIVLLLMIYLLYVFFKNHDLNLYTNLE